MLRVEQSMTPVRAAAVLSHPVGGPSGPGAVEIHNFQFLSNLLIAGSQIAYQLCSRGSDTKHPFQSEAHSRWRNPHADIYALCVRPHVVPAAGARQLIASASVSCVMPDDDRSR